MSLTGCVMTFWAKGSDFLKILFGCNHFFRAIERVVVMHSLPVGQVGCLYPDPRLCCCLRNGLDFRLGDSTGSGVHAGQGSVPGGAAGCWHHSAYANDKGGSAGDVESSHVLPALYAALHTGGGN